jgi:hypothetical protein
MQLPQLSLRELFLMVALVAMGCGWWVERQALSKRNASLKREMDALEREQILALREGGISQRTVTRSYSQP